MQPSQPTVANQGSRASSIQTFVCREPQKESSKEIDIEQRNYEKRNDSTETLPLPSLHQIGQRKSWEKWATVLSAFVVFLNSWGFLLSFGAFQVYYEQNLFPSKSSSDIAWISTVCAFISVVGGLITGPLYDRGYLRPMLVAGIFLEVFGGMMISVSTEYYQVFLSQGICVGIGMALVYVPSLAAVAASFDDKTRPKMLGIIACATGLGGLIYPIMFQRFLESLGFAWAVRVIGFFLLATYAFSFGPLFIKPQDSLTVRPWIDTDAFREKPFVLCMIGTVFYGMAYYIPLLYLPQVADSSSFSSANSSLGFYLIAIVNGVSAAGRLGAGQLAAMIGPVETTTLSLGTSAAVLFCWTAVGSTAGLIVWSVFWGLTSSIVVATLGACVPLLSPSLSVIGTRSGMFWACAGLGLLVGGPIGGATIDVNSPSPPWWHVEICAGFFMSVAALFYIQPLLHVRRNRTAAAAATASQEL